MLIHGLADDNVVVAHTDATGPLQDNPELFRVNPSNGAPEFSPRAFEEKDRVPGWGSDRPPPP
jgi:hypothetical protein